MADRPVKDRRRRRPRTEGAWPNPQPGQQVVLHTRVVTDTGGGPDKTIFYSAPFLAHTNYWLAAAYMHPPRDPGFAALRARAEKARCPLISVPDAGPLDRHVVQKLLRICRRYNVAIWHGHDYKSNMLGLMLRPFWPMKLVTTLHGWVKETNRTPLYYAIDRWCLPYYHHVIAVSDDLVEQAVKVGVKPENCTLLLNGIDEQTFVRSGPAAESPLRREMGTPAGRLVIGGMGRLSPEKAFNNLIYATQRLLQQGLDVELWIAGDGDSRPDLQRLIDHHKLGDPRGQARIRLLGFCNDTIAFYEALDMFVLSSLREGLPNVVLEAMSMSLPVVSTAVAGVPKLISDGESGLLCPIGDIDALAAPMHRLATDPALRDRLAAAARATIEQRFTFRQRMAREKAIYDLVLGKASQIESAQAGAPAPSPLPGVGRGLG
ncbi:MAG: glycosyltransferase [Phycisphaeraceae bacterium]